MTINDIASQRAAGREVEYRRNAMVAYRAGRYLESSQWSRLADYERDRSQRLATVR